MRQRIIVCLILIVITFSACSNQVTDTRFLKTDNQETDQSKEFREGSANLVEANTREEQNFLQENKNLVTITKGVIVLGDRYGKRDFVRLYNEDGSIWYEFTYYYDDSDGKFEYANENFLPFAFHPDYFILALRCVGEDENRYEVIVNEKTGLRKFVRKDDPTLKFVTWEEYVIKVFAVGFDRKENQLREMPNGTIMKVELPNEVVFHPLEIKDDWLKVCWDDSRKRKKCAGTGWVKWRDENHLLIKLFYFS
ncbi:MAG: hypothetical protein D6735_11390 [Acidobacteria bacterium]|nr:MAG: hypothetical protein D6735_11390 [Acidobacteriota bacterium]